MNFEKDIINCLAVLRKGGLILYPSDTIWGIGCDATNAKAVEKIYTLKRREDKRSMIVLVYDEKEILHYVAHPDLKIFDYLREAKKPTSVVYEGAIGFANNLVGKEGTIAIRICQDEFCQHLVKRFRKPLVSTSANISGQDYPKTFQEVSDEVKKGVDYIVQHRQDDLTIAEPSRLIKWEKGKPIILRS